MSEPLLSAEQIVKCAAAASHLDQAAVLTVDAANLLAHHATARAELLRLARDLRAYQAAAQAAANTVRP